MAHHYETATQYRSYIKKKKKECLDCNLAARRKQLRLHNLFDQANGYFLKSIFYFRGKKGKKGKGEGEFRRMKYPLYFKSFYFTSCMQAF